MAVTRSHHRLNFGRRKDNINTHQQMLPRDLCVRHCMIWSCRFSCYKSAGVFNHVFDTLRELLQCRCRRMDDPMELIMTWLASLITDLLGRGKGTIGAPNYSSLIFVLFFSSLFSYWGLSNHVWGFSLLLVGSESRSTNYSSSK